MIEIDHLDFQKHRTSATFHHDHGDYSHHRSGLVRLGHAFRSAQKAATREEGPAGPRKNS